MNTRSLRDIKKEATAHALADAAFELAMDRGMDGFVVDDVVQLAGYSRRTFANHFSCKEEAVATAAILFDRGKEKEAEHILASLDNEMPFLDKLYSLLKLQLTADLFAKMRHVIDLSKHHPSLEPYILNAFRSLQVEAQEQLGAMAQGRYPEGYVQMLTGALYGAIMPVIDGSLNVRLPDSVADEKEDATPFEQYLDTLYGYLRNGF
ncbi:TetR/AcrR family transcriptional regulator [Paenibacillus daejeonensis]|uniref:TetR/AcrR family transcriptional regulator n=1 Tax=Paenibacillus daejeonensis TaxID=135193 RepID=UPI0003684B4B|nr:TetR/AcrR family transcriptional regulator [Paenibacillus daejeonensis]